MPTRPLHASPRKKGTDSEGAGTPWISGFQLAALLSSAVLASGFLSLAIQSLRSPDRPLPPAQSSAKNRELDALFATTLSRPQPAAIELLESEINAHLTQALAPAVSRNATVRFKRAGIRLLNARIEWTSLHEYAGREFQLQMLLKVWVSNGKLQIQRETTHLGRLPLSPFFSDQTLQCLRHIWPLLKKETALLNRLDALQWNERSVFMKIRSSAPATP